jgi:hypothetical protein
MFALILGHLVISSSRHLVPLRPRHHRDEPFERL